MSTKIYGVDYWITEVVDGDSFDLRQSTNVVAKDVEDAISKVRKKEVKPYSYISDETKKRVKVARKNLKAITVILRAEADY